MDLKTELNYFLNTLLNCTHPLKWDKSIHSAEGFQIEDISQNGWAFWPEWSVIMGGKRSFQDIAGISAKLSKLFLSRNREKWKNVGKTFCLSKC